MGNEIDFECLRCQKTFLDSSTCVCESQGGFTIRSVSKKLKVQNSPQWTLICHRIYSNALETFMLPLMSRVFELLNTNSLPP